MSQPLKDRTKAFGISIIKLVREIKGGNVEDVLVRQVVRSATSVGANYRSALRARSQKDFISKLAVAEEGADETCYWLEIIHETEILKEQRVIPVLKEAQEITAILTTSGKTARRNLKT